MSLLDSLVRDTGRTFVCRSHCREARRI